MQRKLRLRKNVRGAAAPRDALSDHFAGYAVIMKPGRADATASMIVRSGKKKRG